MTTKPRSPPRGAALAAQADPNRPLLVVEAIRHRFHLQLTLVLDPSYVATDVGTAVTSALVDGLFAPGVLGLGEVLYRSRIEEVVLAVPGVLATRGLTARWTLGFWYRLFWSGARVRPRCRRVLHPQRRRPRALRRRSLPMTETPVRDLYEERYADKLWSLIPAVYRAVDSQTLDGDGPLRELLGRIGASMAVVRRSIDRLWEDQSVETCDSWVVPYIADLLATNLVPSMDARGQRLDVANTIFYRRRKGTVALLEQLAHDVTGYETRVIEFFRRLSRNRHNLDPAIGLPMPRPPPPPSPGSAPNSSPVCSRGRPPAAGPTCATRSVPRSPAPPTTNTTTVSTCGSAAASWAGTASRRSASSCGGRTR